MQRPAMVWRGHKGARRAALAGLYAAGMATGLTPPAHATEPVQRAASTPTESAKLGTSLRLEQALELALEHNERARQAELRVDAATGAVIRARAGFLPSLNVGGTASLSDARAARGLDPISASGTVTVQQPLIVPSTWPQYSQQKRLQRAEAAGALQDKRTLAFDVARAYIQAIAGEQAVAAAQSRMDRAQANFDVASARADAQLAGSNDLTRARLDLASAAQSRATQQGSLQRAYLTLSFMLGQEVDGALEPPDGLTRTTELLAQGVERLLAEVRERRADLRELQARADAASASAAEPYYRMFPTLSAQGQIRATPGVAELQRASEMSATLNLQWPLFDGGSRYGDLRQRQAQAESQKLAVRLQERNAEITVRQALASFDAAQQAFAHASEAVAAADRSIDETEVLYQQGLARGIELTTANGQRFDAEIARVSAKLALEQACFDLRAALGLNPLDDGPGAPGEQQRSVK